MVEVFKTNVDLVEQSDIICARLLNLFPNLQINFDLDDCDRILRVQGKMIQVHKIISELKPIGFACEVLD